MQNLFNLRILSGQIHIALCFFANNFFKNNSKQNNWLKCNTFLYLCPPSEMNSFALLACCIFLFFASSSFGFSPDLSIFPLFSFFPLIPFLPFLFIFHIFSYVTKPQIFIEIFTQKCHKTKIYF